MSLFKLPREILITHIFRSIHLTPQNTLSLQRTSKKIKTYLWKAVDRLDLNEWSVDVDPNVLLDRLDDNIVTYLDLTGYNFIDSKGVELSTSDILRRYPSLEILKVDEIPDVDFADLKLTIPGHKCLIEIVTYGKKAEEKHRAISEHIRLTIKSTETKFNQFLDVPTFNCETTPFLRINQCSVSCAINFNSEITSNGINVKGTTFLGGADGSIFVIAKRSGSLIITQQVKEHDGPINRLHHIIQKPDLILAASEDGSISKWQWSQSKLTLIHKYSMPEPMYFVAGFEASKMAAASKHNLYSILSERISDTPHHFEEDITDLDVQAERSSLSSPEERPLYIATTMRCYKTTNFREISVVEKYADPDPENGSPYKNCKRLYPESTDNTGVEYYFYGDCAAKTCFKILAMELYFTVTAVGSVIQIEYEGTEQSVLARISPRVSRGEISSKKFPECKSVWYAQDYIYAVFSNNKLYRWSLGIEGRYKKH